MKTYQPSDKEVKEINDFIYDEVQRVINLGSPVSSPVFEKKLSLPFEFVVCNALITTNDVYLGDFPEPTYRRDSSISLGPVYGQNEDETFAIEININHLENSRIYEN